MRDLESLLDKVSDRAVSEESRREMWDHIAERWPEERSASVPDASDTGTRRSAAWVLVPALAAAAAGVLIIVMGTSDSTSTPDRHADASRSATEVLDEARHSSAQRPLTTAQGAPLEPALHGSSAQRREVGLADGSTLFLEAGAVLRVAENTGARLTLLLEQGRVTFDVEPGRRRLWSILAGPATVEVVGTLFVVDRRADSVQVDVERGTVRVRGERVQGLVRTLNRGESLTVPASERAPAEVVASTEASAETGTNIQAPQARMGRRSWRRLAEGGDHSEAYEALGARGLATETEGATDVETLLLLADIARLTHHPSRAVAPLERVLSDFARDPRAPAAAFTLGRLQLDSLRQPRVAAEAFERAIELGASAALLEDAHLRVVEARMHAGDRAGAREAAQRYLTRFPDGRHTEAALRVLAAGGVGTL